MTVLLIDASGHRRVMEVAATFHAPLLTILVPVPTSFSTRIDETPQPCQQSIAVFELSDELLYQPVYRWVGLRS